MKKLMLIILLGLSLPIGSAWGASNLTTSKNHNEQLFNKIATDYETELFEYQPELGLFWGKTDVALDRFMDNSLEGLYQWQKKEDRFLKELNALDPQALRNPSEYMTYHVLKEALEANQGSRICREELWDVNPASGWHSRLAMIADKQPIGTSEYRRQAIQRWQSFNKVVDDQITNLKVGLELGYTAPKPAVKRVLTQLNIVLNGPIENSPYFAFGQRDSDLAFKQKIKTIIQAVVHPALQKYATFLETQYLSASRDEIGLFALPNGSACYLAKIKQETTLGMTPQAIHDLGLKLMQGLAQEIGDIGLLRYHSREMAVIFQQAKIESEHYFSSEQAILEYNYAALQRVQALIPQWFGHSPKAPGTIRPYPEYRAKTGASGEYHPPNETGTEPGIFYINTYDPKNRGRIDQEATLFHELIPGHHFQIALQYENKALPKVSRYLFNSGFGEGWALYVERLADEMGLYQDDISRLGMLSNEALRTSRLVVDTGIHAFHWTRQQAIEYLKQHTAISEEIIEGEVDRYIMMPGQATSYMLGKKVIENLRTQARQDLGDRFDIRSFHDEVLKYGAISLPMLQEHIHSWIKSQVV